MHVAVADVVPVVATPPAQFALTGLGVIVEAPQVTADKNEALVGHQVVALPVQAKPAKAETAEVYVPAVQFTIPILQPVRLAEPKAAVPQAGVAEGTQFPDPVNVPVLFVTAVPIGQHSGVEIPGPQTVVDGVADEHD